MAEQKKTRKKKAADGDDAVSASAAETKVQATEAAVVAQMAPFDAFTVSCEGYVALNVRPEPRFGGRPLRTLKHGDKVEAAPAADGWFELADGGFVKAEFLV